MAEDKVLAWTHPIASVRLVGSPDAVTDRRPLVRTALVGSPDPVSGRRAMVMATLIGVSSLNGPTYGAGTATILIGATARGRIRRRGTGATTITLATTGRARIRKRGKGATAIALAATGSGRRRRRASGATTLTMAATAKARDWFEQDKFADLAAVADFNRDRYAITTVSLANIPTATAAELCVKRAATFDEFFAFTTTSSVKRTYVDAGGVVRTMPSVNTPRFDYTNGKRQLQLNGAAANLNRNSVAAGLVAGSVLTPPTYWTGSLNANGGTAGTQSLDTSNGAIVLAVYDLAGATPTAGAGVLGFDSSTFLAATPGQVYVGSVYAKLFSGTTFCFTSLDLNIREYDSGGVFLRQAGVPMLGMDGTLRRYVTPAITIGASTAFIHLAVRTNYNGTAAAFKIGVGAPQIELSPFASPFMPTGMNLLLRTQEIGGTSWVANLTPTVTLNAGIAPDGTTTASLIGDDDATQIEGWQQNVTITSSSSAYTFSCHLKAGTSSVASLRANIQTGGTLVPAELIVDLSNGTAKWRTGVVGTSFAVAALADGWYRVSLVATDNSTGNTSAQMLIRPAVGPYATAATVTATGDCLVWGAQIELGLLSPYVANDASRTNRAIETARFSPTIEAILARNAASIVVRGQNLLRGGAKIVGTQSSAATDCILRISNASTGMNTGGASGEIGSSAAAAVTNIAWAGAVGYDEAAPSRAVVRSGGTISASATAPATPRTNSYLARDGSGASATADGHYDFVGIAPDRRPDARLTALAVAA